MNAGVLVHCLIAYQINLNVWTDVVLHLTAPSLLTHEVGSPVLPACLSVHPVCLSIVTVDARGGWPRPPPACLSVYPSCLSICPSCLLTLDADGVCLSVRPVCRPSVPMALHCSAHDMMDRQTLSMLPRAASVSIHPAHRPWRAGLAMDAVLWITAHTPFPSCDQASTGKLIWGGGGILCCRNGMSHDSSIN
jgi:hypothetical protein